MSIVSLFPDASTAGNTEQKDFEREVAARFGLVPNFFRSEPDAPFVIRELWAFAKSAYLDNPIPSLFKERLFVYLSRFCEARYCITRHCGFLLGLGRSAGDPHVPAMTIAQVIHLLQRPLPTEERAGMAFSRLESLPEPIAWPAPETSHDDDLLTAATVLFLQPARAGRAKQALQARTAGPGASHFRNAADRVAAIAAVHEQLHKFDDVGTVALDGYLTALCQAIATASTSADREWSLIVDAEPLIINTDAAVPLALIVNELVTNAIQHSRPEGEGGRVHVVLKSISPDHFSVSVSDSGDGPALTRPSGVRLGTRIVDSLARQIDATISKVRRPSGYSVTVTVPRSPGPAVDKA